MTESTQYPYSLKFSLGTIVLMVLLMLILLNNVIRANTLATWIMFGICLGIFSFLLILLIGKRLIPALKGDIALAMDDDGLNDYIRDVSIAWKDIESINLVRGRSASIIRIDLKWESDYGSHLAIPLRWIKGKDDDIYDTVMAYFEQDPASLTE